MGDGSDTFVNKHATDDDGLTSRGDVPDVQVNMRRVGHALAITNLVMSDAFVNKRIADGSGSGSWRDSRRVGLVLSLTGRNANGTRFSLDCWEDLNEYHDRAENDAPPGGEDRKSGLNEIYPQISTQEASRQSAPRRETAQCIQGRQIDRRHIGLTTPTRPIRPSTGMPPLRTTIGEEFRR